MGIEPILSAWKAEVLAIIRMAQVWLNIEPTVIIYHILYLKLFWLLYHEVNILVYVYSYYVYDNTNSNNIHLLRRLRDASNILSLAVYYMNQLEHSLQRCTRRNQKPLDNLNIPM